MSMMLASLFRPRRVHSAAAEGDYYLAGAAVPTKIPKLTGIRRATGVLMRRSRSGDDVCAFDAEDRRGSVDEPKLTKQMAKLRLLQGGPEQLWRRSSVGKDEPPNSPSSGEPPLLKPGLRRGSYVSPRSDVEPTVPHALPALRRRSEDPDVGARFDPPPPKPWRHNRRSSTDDATQRRSSQRTGEGDSPAGAPPRRLGRTRTEPALLGAGGDDWAVGKPEGRGFTLGTSASGSPQGVRRKDVAAEARAAQGARAARSKEIKDQFTGTKMSGVLIQIHRELDEKKLSQKELFNRLDVSGDGQLSRAEMQYGLRKLGVTLQKEELAAFVSGFDADGNGEVDFEEFSRLISNHAVSVASELDESARVCGYKTGSTVLLTIKVNGLKEKEQGIVLGPGTQPGTVMVRFGKPGLVSAQQTLSLKPMQIKPQKV